MRNVLTIFRKEIKSYFASPIAYLLMAIFAVIFGYFFYVATAIFVQRGMESQMMGQGQPMDMNEWMIRPLLMNVSVIGLFLIPMISMRLFAEEKRSGTIELLMTSPIRDIEIVLGKWCRGCGDVRMHPGDFRAQPGIPVRLWQAGLEADPGGLPGPAAAGRRLLAVGAFISTMTKNQIIAGGATFAVCLLLWVFDWVSSYETAAWAKVLSYCSVMTHFEAFAKGVLDTKDVVFYLSMIFFGLFLTARSMESLRWRA